jgi:hypothetical protein
MNISPTAPSKLAGSISAATSPPSSSGSGASASAPFGDWLVVGDAAVDPKRAVAMKGRYQKLEMSFDCGHLIEFALVDNASGKDVMQDLIKGINITARVKLVSITNP